jgi:hypothetical protein
VLSVEAGDARRGRADWNTEVPFDEMFAEGGGVRGAAARACDNDTGRISPQPQHEFGQKGPQGLLLPGHNLWRGCDLARH